MGHMNRQQHFIVSDDLMAWVRAEAERRSCSLSQVVRDLIVAEQKRQKRRVR